MFRKDGASPEKGAEIFKYFMTITPKEAEEHENNCLAFSDAAVKTWDIKILENELRYHHCFRFGLINTKNIFKLKKQYYDDFFKFTNIDGDALKAKAKELEKFNAKNNKCIRQFCKRIINEFDPNITYSMNSYKLYRDYSLYFLWDPINKQFLTKNSKFEKGKKLKIFLDYVISKGILNFKYEDLSGFLSGDALQIVFEQMINEIKRTEKLIASGDWSGVNNAESLFFIMHLSHFDNLKEIADTFVKTIYGCKGKYNEKLSVLKDIKNFAIEYDVSHFQNLFDSLDSYSERLWNDNMIKTKKDVSEGVNTFISVPIAPINVYRMNIEKGIVPVLSEKDTYPQTASMALYKMLKGKLGINIVGRYEFITALNSESDEMQRNFLKQFNQNMADVILKEYESRIDTIVDGDKVLANKIKRFLRKIKYFLFIAKSKDNRLPIIYFSVGVIEYLIDHLFSNSALPFLSISNLSQKKQRNREWKLVQILKTQRSGEAINIDLLTIIYTVLYDREYYGGMELRNRMVHFEWRKKNNFTKASFAIIILMLYFIDDFISPKHS